jgi:hypothetical protein
MALELIHIHGKSVQLRYNEQLLFSYHYGAHTHIPNEFHRPYFHPVNTLAGDTITLLRPFDRPYQRGLSLSLGMINGQNFWGGPPEGDAGAPVASLDRVGRAAHVQWEALKIVDDERQLGDDRPPTQTALLHERIHWQTSQGETWLREDRRMLLETLNERAGYWVLRLSSRLTNVSGEPLTIQQGASDTMGVTGWFLRAVRGFESGRVFTADGATGAEVSGSRALWCGLSGEHDTHLRGSTVVLQGNPQNPRHPTHWYAPMGDYAGLGMALCYEEPLDIPPTHVLHLRCRLIVANGDWTYTPVESVLSTMPLITDTDYERR